MDFGDGDGDDLDVSLHGSSFGFVSYRWRKMRG